MTISYISHYALLIGSMKRTGILSTKQMILNGLKNNYKWILKSKIGTTTNSLTLSYYSYSNEFLELRAHRLCLKREVAAGLRE